MTILSARPDRIAAGIVIVMAAGLACTAPPATTAPPARPSQRCEAPVRAAPGGVWPMCGVLTEEGYGHEGELTFVVPGDLRQPRVRRYNIEDATEHVAPLSAYAGWWFCITRGTVKKPETETELGTEYGLIAVEEFTIDQSTGERGQE